MMIPSFTSYEPFSDFNMGLVKLLGLDKIAKLSTIIKNHGGLRASLYHLYQTDDLKVGFKKHFVIVKLTVMLCA